MRYLFTLVIAILFILPLVAQNKGGCGTIRPENFQHFTSENERSMNSVFAPSRAAVRNVPVVYHVVAKNNGTGAVSLKTIFETHCQLNIGFQQPQVHFYIHEIDTIYDDALWSMSDGAGGTDHSLGYAAFSDYNFTNYVNVYITGQMPGLCGFATFPGWAPRGGGLFLNKSCCGKNEQTIPHEMGHFLNLDHTFNQTNPVEYVNGTNCTTKGDGFCDTPADFLDSRTACPYTGLQTDPNGDLYNVVIDETLFMSYFNDNCINRFSPQQQNEMNSVLSGTRSGLLNHTAPNVSPLDAAIMISPKDGDTTVNSISTRFEWRAVARAQYYVLFVQSASSSVVLVDTLIKDTFFSVANLAPNKGYKFKVIPISFTNTCGDNAVYQNIQTAAIKATMAVSVPSCPGYDNASVTVSATNGSSPYSYAWSNGQTTASATNLYAGSYEVTITDNNGEVVIATVFVTEPSPVTVGINKVGNNLTATGNGGTPPYTYNWSNGATGPGNNNIGFGSYSVTITDSKGCTSTQTFVYSSLGVELEAKVVMNVFPNPAYKTASLNLQVELNERIDANILLMNLNGETIQQVKREFTPGTNKMTINIENLSSGVYFIQFKALGMIETGRVSIIR